MEKNMTKMELLKKLEFLIAFQTNCLTKEDWGSYDLAENEVDKVEREIISKMKSEPSRK